MSDRRASHSEGAGLCAALWSGCPLPHHRPPRCAFRASLSLDRRRARLSAAEQSRERERACRSSSVPSTRVSHACGHSSPHPSQSSGAASAHGLAGQQQQPAVAPPRQAQLHSVDDELNTLETNQHSRTSRNASESRKRRRRARHSGLEWRRRIAPHTAAWLVRPSVTSLPRPQSAFPVFP